MALAILEPDGPSGNGHRFRVDIGTNRFFSWAVGNGDEPDVVEGTKLLSRRTHESPLMGPLGARSMGRTVIDVPRELFDRENRHVQLLSFKERNLHGPAASDILAVGHRLDGGSLPGAVGLSINGHGVDTVGFRAARRPVSTAMFMEALSGLLPHLVPVLGQVASSLAPHLGNVLGNLLQGGARGRPASPPGGPPATAATNAQLLNELLQRLVTTVTTPPARNGTAPASPSPGQTAAAPRGPAAASLAMQARLSHAQVAPALLAALPALMPLLQNVLSPQTIQTVLQTADPNRLLGTIANAIQGFAQIGLQADREQMAHLERINPGIDRDLPALLGGMSMSRSLGHSIARGSKAGPRPYQRVSKVRIEFAGLAPQTLNGRGQVFVLAGQKIAFEVAVETPRPLPKALLHLVVKESATLKEIIETSWPVRGLSTGKVEPAPGLSADEASKLRPGTEYIACFTLTFPGKGNKRFGTTRHQLFTVAGRYTFDRVEQTTEIVPLNDVEAHREFWHKAWEGTFEGDRRKVVFNCQYNYGLDGRASRNAQMESVVETEPGSSRHEVGSLRTGFVASPVALNRLIPRISSHPELNDGELAALRTRDFADRFSQGARTQLTMRGRPGDSAAIWVYPEVKLQRVILREAIETNESGHVTRFADHPVFFPFFALAHFIGVGTQ